jgi:hypothetical protein
MATPLSKGMGSLHTSVATLRTDRSATATTDVPKVPIRALRTSTGGTATKRHGGTVTMDGAEHDLTEFTRTFPRQTEPRIGGSP